MTYVEKEVTPTTISKVQKVADLLLEAQLLANGLVVNDMMEVLKMDGQNVDHHIMQIRSRVLEYKNQLVDAPLF